MLLAVPLQPVLENPTLKPAFDYVLPALFGGLVAQSVLKGKKEVAVWLGCVAVCYLLMNTGLGAAVLYDHHNCPGRTGLLSGGV